MPWFPVDDGFAFHRKCVRAGNAAVGLWTRSGSWCAQQLTDGFVPEDIALVLGTPAQASRLVSSGLWVAIDGGYVFHQWSEEGRNPTREKVLQRRKNEAEKKARQRGQKSTKVQGGANCPPGTVPGLPQGLPGGVPAIPSPPLPSTKEQETKTSASGDAGMFLDIRPATPETPRYDEDFDTFWASYPLKRGKEPARKAFIKARKSGVPLDTMCAGARAYGLEVRGLDPSKVKYPQGWISDRRWQDYDEPGQPRLRAVSGGYQPYQNPTDQSEYDAPI